MTQRVMRVMAVALTLGLGGGACAGNPFQKEDPPAPLTVSQGADSYAQSLCGKFQQCIPFYVELLFGDGATCRSRMAAQTTAVYGLPGANASGDAIARCGQDIAAQSCDDAIYGDSPASCSLPGTRAAGTGCASGSQCVTQVCRVTGAQSCGTCGAVVGAGQVCMASVDCEGDLVCENNVCATVTRLNAGDACVATSRTRVCSGNTYCRTPALSSNGTCAVPGALDAACDPDDDDACDTLQALTCDSATQRCKRFRMAASGQACGGVPEGITLCRASGDCSIPTGASMGTCAAPAADGATCGGTQDISCRYPADCNSANICELTASCG